LQWWRCCQTPSGPWGRGETPRKAKQFEHITRTGPEIKDKRRESQKCCAKEAQIRDSPKGGELDPAVEDRWVARTILPF